MAIFYFKLRQTRGSEYLVGYAAKVVIGEGRILLQDRRIPLVIPQGDKLIATSHRLADLELETEDDLGWAAWAYEIPAPPWWSQGEVAGSGVAASGNTSQDEY